MPRPNRHDRWIIYARMLGESQWRTAQEVRLSRDDVVAILSSPERLQNEVLNPLRLTGATNGHRVEIIIVAVEYWWDPLSHGRVESPFFTQQGVRVADSVGLDREIFAYPYPAGKRHHLSVYGSGFQVDAGGM